MKKVIFGIVFFSTLCFSHGNFFYHHSSHNSYDTHHFNLQRDYHNDLVHRSYVKDKYDVHVYHKENYHHDIDKDHNIESYKR